jgi:RHS repeat-associated protein
MKTKNVPQRHAAGLGAVVMLLGLTPQTSQAQATAHQLQSMTQTDTTTHTAPYATNGRTRTWGYGWSPTGQLLSVDGPLAGTGDTVTYTYGANGYLASVTNEVGQTTTMSAWNFRGQPTTIVDPNGVSSTFTYDFHGRVLSATVNPGPAQSQYSFEYNAVGDVTKVTMPGGGFLEYTYNTGRQLSLITNDRGQTRTLTNNLLSQVTGVTTKTSSGAVTQQETRAYDELGRLIRTIGAGSQTWTYGYDKVGNATSQTDARSKVFGTTFDALNRVIAEAKPGSETVEYAYNGADVLTRHEDGRNLQTNRTVDGFGQVIQEVSPERGTLKYWYDAAGRLTKLVDGDNEETNYTYDAAGRRLTATFPGASHETITYSYDATAGGNKGVGRLTGVTEESGSTAFVYDAQGRLTNETKTIQGRSYAVGYAYDANGEVTQITLPSGRTVTYMRGADGLASAVATSAGGVSTTLASGITYRPFGPLSLLTYGNGLHLTRSYDNNYWLSQIEVKSGGTTRLDLSFNRNANGQLEGVVDNASSGRGASFGYYDTGRLQYGVGPWGDESYVYDQAGNRTEKRRDVGGTVTYEFAIPSGSSNRVVEVQGSGGTLLRTLNYRNGGDLWLDDAVSGDDYEYAYNARKRLVAIKKNGTDAAWYGYDYAGRRVWRSVFATTTAQSHYVFDTDGRLLAEHDGSTGALLREYVWLDDMLLASVDATAPTPQIYYVHTGQIDEPLVVTDASMAKVWDAFVEPYGKAQVFGTPTAGLDLRLPGQWFEAEAGLHQNWHRSYDPRLGRYIQADPLGVEAGQNLYVYALGDPLRFVDRDGRFVFVLPAIPAIAGGLEVAAVATATVVGGVAAWHGGKWIVSHSEKNSCPIPGVTPLPDTKGRTKQFEKPGGYDQANEDFDQVREPGETKTLPDGGRVGRLPDGRPVVVRPNSSDGRPTVEIQSGKNRVKVRYGP